MMMDYDYASKTILWYSLDVDNSIIDGVKVLDLCQFQILSTPVGNGQFHIIRW